MKAYTIMYKMNRWDKPEKIEVLARSKTEAYDKACFEAIPKVKKYMPYSAWVYSVTYNNGNYHKFNTSEGNAY